MSQELPERYRELQTEVRQFISAHRDQSPALGGGRKRPDQKTRDWQRLLVEHGYAARFVPSAYGGFGATQDVFEAAIIAEEFGSAGMHPGMMNQGVSMFVPTLLAVGTPAQCEKWVPPTIRGDIIWCQGFSEPSAGSDLAAVKTRATVENDEFVINGHKVWTSSAHYADMMFLLCRTEPDRPKHLGLSYLIVPMTTPGITVQPIKTATGRYEFNEIFLDDVRVPLENIVKGRGDGWEVANITLKNERMNIGDANRLDMRLQRIIKLLSNNKVDGTPLIETAEYLTRVLKLQGELMAWKAHNRRLLSDEANGVDPGVNRLILKYGGAMIGHRLSSLALDAMGSTGVVFESGGEDAQDDEISNWNNDYLYDIGLLIGGGTLNIQKNIIGDRGLGLPREPKPAAPVAAGGRA